MLAADSLVARLGRARGRPGRRRARGRIIVTVDDQTGLVDPERVGARDAAGRAGRRRRAPKPVMTGGTGVAVVDDLPDGRYTIEVEFPGFETAVVRDVRVRGGDVRRRVTLQIQRVEEGLTVSRDRQIVGARSRRAAPSAPS